MMNQKVKKEVQKIINKYNLDCTVSTFKYSKYVDWIHIFCYQNLSISFIKEFKNKVDWGLISCHQTLSENFIREFKDKVDWVNISYHQTLSEEFIREFKDKVDWGFIRQIPDLSNKFLKDFSYKINLKLYNKIHQTKIYKQKLKEVKTYCNKYDLELDLKNKCFYAYRIHDEQNRGIYNGGPYDIGYYYRDWHCDMDKDNSFSFGLGIWPKKTYVNGKVKVLIEDWGVEPKMFLKKGKARVWGFEIVEDLR